MASEAARFPPRAIAAALSRAAYHTDRVRLADPDIAGFDCLVSARRGLFAVARDGRVRRVAHGFFFGMQRIGGHLYLFEACDHPAAPSGIGRVVRIRIEAGRLEEPAIIVKRLDNNCHQLAIFDDRLHVVDTTNQAILRFHCDGTPIDRVMPIGPRGGDPHAYRHINSVARIGDRIAVLLHNGAGGIRRASELAWFDAEWRPIAREPLPGFGCHDIVADAAGTIWHCGSLDGDLINSAGLRRRVTDRMTRGLAVTGDGIVVGTSSFGRRDERDDLGGTLLFLDRALAVRAEVALPAQPADIILIEGADRGAS